MSRGGGCVLCGSEIPPGRRKFCSDDCTAVWHTRKHRGSYTVTVRLPWGVALAMAKNYRGKGRSMDKALQEAILSHWDNMSDKERA